MTAKNNFFWGSSQDSISYWLEKSEKNELIERIWKKDPTVWKKNPSEHKEISNRLGWLTAPTDVKSSLKDIQAFAEEIKSEGLSHVVLIGMGGSSLGSEVFSLSLGIKEGYPKLLVLDSTDPLRVKDVENQIDLKKTLFIVSSKSGNTIELISLFKYFLDKCKYRGSSFIAITDPSSPLEELAKKSQFRKIFLAPPDVGGRFSVLTVFGLVPAALIGVDIEKIVESAQVMAKACGSANTGLKNPAMALGLGMAVLAEDGKDKLTFLTSKSIRSFGDWAEQLVAESTGKEEMGVIPVVGEEIDLNQEYGQDRFFAVLTLKGEEDPKLTQLLASLKAKGHPYIHYHLEDKYQLGAEFFRWELATAIASSLLKINAFDQPDVQAAKDSAKSILKTMEQGKKIQVTLPETDLDSFFEDIRPEDYIAILAFLPGRPAIKTALNELRSLIRTATGKAVTVGLGPRYLHSTGQLHKGGPNQALFLLITSAHPDDVTIPGEKFTFAELELAQAMGELKALESKSRAVFHVRLKSPNETELGLFVDKVRSALAAQAKGSAH